VAALRATVGEGEPPPVRDASLAIIGSVLMPVLIGRGGTLAEGGAWIDRALVEVRGL
jgi:hypothetical protein